MGAWDLCKVFVRVRFSHPPPNIARSSNGRAGPLHGSDGSSILSRATNQFSRYSEMVSPDVWDVEAQVRFLLPRPSFVIPFDPKVFA